MKISNSVLKKPKMAVTRNRNKYKLKLGEIYIIERDIIR